MMNKYTLGTVLGTALLGVAKSKLGSGVRIKKGYKEIFEATLYVTLNEHYFLPLEEQQIRQDILDQIKSIVESYGAIFNGYEIMEFEQELGFEIVIDYSMQIDISKTHFSEQQIEAYVMNDFESELYNIGDQIHFMLNENNIFPDNVNVGDFITKHSYIHPYTQSKSGEWVPYTSSTADSKLRKR